MEKMEATAAMDLETEFLQSKKESGNEWELFKENVRPLKRGRNVRLLNEALRSSTDSHLKQSLLHHRRKLIEAIDEYKGEDPLQPWLECIKWVQESFPSGGEYSGLIVIYEQCVRSFWHSERYKDDLRYLKVWMEYADNCADAEVVYSFLHANQIGQTHSLFYISYALHMESKNKPRKADEIFNLGIARKVQPIEKLEASYKKFLIRSTKRIKAAEDMPIEDHQSVRSFGTLLAPGEDRRPTTEKCDLGRQRVMLQRLDRNIPLSVYNDTNGQATTRHQPVSLKGDTRSWLAIGTQKERNKENTTIPSKWSSNKIPQRGGGFRRQAATGSTCIEVFVDEECAELPSATNRAEHLNPSILQLRRGDSKDLKKETELLKQNPLRNFPPNSLPR